MTHVLTRHTAWMKTSNNSGTGGVLLGDVGGQYYQTWANYLVKFLQAYKEQGIDIWGVCALFYHPVSASHHLQAHRAKRAVGRTEQKLSVQRTWLQCGDAGCHGCLKPYFQLKCGAATVYHTKPWPGPAGVLSRREADDQRRPAHISAGLCQDGAVGPRGGQGTLGTTRMHVLSPCSMSAVWPCTGMWTSSRVPISRLERHTTRFPTSSFFQQKV